MSVTIVAGQCVEVVADDGNGEKFELTHSLPFPLRSDRTARAIKFSKKTGRLTLEFQKLPTEYTHTGSNASNTSGDDTPKKEKQTNAAPEAPGAFVVPNSFPNAAESLVYVFSDLRRGRGLRARRSLTAGSIVFVTPPITCTTHDTRKDDLCGFCFHELCLSSSSSSSTRTCEECFTGAYFPTQIPTTVLGPALTIYCLLRHHKCTVRSYKLRTVRKTDTLFDSSQRIVQKRVKKRTLRTSASALW